MKATLFIKTHRILALCFSVLFLMWFLSGFVMMFHTYPQVKDKQKLEHYQFADTSVLSIFQMVESLPIPKDSITGISFYKRAGTNILKISDASNDYFFNAENGERLNGFSKEQLQRIAEGWNEGNVVLKDSLSAIDVWLIGVYPFRDYPVYHYVFAGKDKAELYLSSRTGEALQYTTRASRFWAWVGAIPHWIYIKQFRAHGRQPWTNIVMWISGIGTLMVLSGLIVGIRSFFIARRMKRRGCPYTKSLFRWHHIFGLFFGLFVLTWIFSGFMSMTKVPQWLSKVHVQRDVAKEINGEYLQLDSFKLDYKYILFDHPAKRITWMSMDGHPMYKIESDNDTCLIDASSLTIRKYNIDEKFCKNMVRHIRQDQAAVGIKLMNTYDNYYLNFKQPLPLPVYKIKVDDSDGSCYYINPKDGSFRYYNHNTRCRVWLYRVLHSFNCTLFIHHPFFKTVMMLILLTGGTIVSLTGVFLTIRYIRRKLK